MFDLQGLGQDEGDSAFATLLKENKELQSKNADLIERLADQEKKSNNYKAEIQLLRENRKAEIETLRAEKADSDRKFRSLQQQQGNVQVISQERDGLMNELSRLNQELMKMRESLDFMARQKSNADERIKELGENSEHLKIEYDTEKEDNDKLRAKIVHLQRQFDSLLGMNTGVAVESGDTCSEGQSTVNVSQLQERIKQLNDDIAKVNEHSKSQSRQILKLRQQTEVTEVHVHTFTHCTCTCMYIM